jgi:hypothetical protein
VNGRQWDGLGQFGFEWDLWERLGQNGNQGATTEPCIFVHVTTMLRSFFWLLLACAVSLSVEGLLFVYENCKFMDSQYQYRFYWNITTTSPYFYGAIEAPAQNGWIGLGIAVTNVTQNFMISDGLGTDIIAGWIAQNGSCATGCIGDYWADTYNGPVLDPQQNVALLNAEMTPDGNVTIEFFRLLNTSDTQRDRVIVPNTLQRFNWAFNPAPNAVATPNGSVLLQHPFSNSGSVVIDLSQISTCGVANNAVNSFTNAAGTYIAEWQIVDQFITITFQGQTPTTGWLGFGINGQNQMPGGDVVVGWIDPNTNQATLIDRYAQQRAMPPADTDLGGTNDILNFTGRNEQRNGQNWMIFTYTRKLNTGDRFDVALDPTQTTYLLWALGPSSGVDYSTGTYYQHADRGTAPVNFFGGCVPPPSTKGDTLRRIHAMVMIVGWTLFLYTGIYVARYMKGVTVKWFVIHVVFQSIGVAAVLAGFIIIFVTLGVQVIGVHQLFGLFVFIFTELQPFVGLLADRLYDPGRKKVPVFPDQIHWWIGRITMLLAAVTIFLGINQYIPNVIIAFVLYGAYLGLCLAILIASEVQVGQVHETDVFEMTTDNQKPKLDDKNEKAKKAAKKAKINYIVFIVGSVVIIGALLGIVGTSTSQYTPTVSAGIQICNSTAT